MNLPRCTLELTNPPADWREWVKSLTDAELADVKGKLAQFGLKAERAMLPQIEAIEQIVRDECVIRFPEVVAGRKAVATALDSLKAMYDEAVKLRDEYRQQLNGLPASDSETWSTPSQREALEGARS